MPVTWYEFEQHVLPSIQDVMSRLMSSDMLSGLRDPEGIENEIFGTVNLIEVTLQTRGMKYGEDVLCLIGEEGITVLAVTKAMRLLFSQQEGKDWEDREDSWLDLAGYSILALAVERYRRNLSQE